MAYELCQASPTDNLRRKFVNMNVAVPDRFRDHVRQNVEQEFGETTAYNRDLGESVLRRILAYANGDTDYQTHSFRPTRGNEGRYYYLIIQVWCPRNLHSVLKDDSETYGYSDLNANKRVYHNNSVEEFVLRKIILGDYAGGNE